jgi:hypothetical protein
MPYSRDEVEQSIAGLAQAFKTAEQMNRWSWIAD